MNVKLLKEIKEQILKEPKQFNMDDWFHDSLRWKIPNCGTAACIGGWAIALSHRLNPLEAHKLFRLNTSAPEKLLDLDEEQAGRLFYQGSWPSQFQSYGLKGKASPKVRAKRAAARIDHFIKTDGEE